MNIEDTQYNWRISRLKPVSVIIPTYNRVEQLRHSVNSVLSQSYNEFELIIVDDASTDHTEEYVKSIKDNRIVYYRMPSNRGASAARNKGVDMARYEIIAFQDSDDVWKVDKLEKQMDYWDKNSDHVLIYSAYEYPGIRRVPDTNDIKQLEGNIFPFLLLRNTIGTPTILTRKDIFIDQGGFDVDFRSLEDWDMVIRIARAGTIGYVDDVLVEAGISQGGISSSISNYFDARCRMILKYYMEFKEYEIFDDAVLDLFKRAEKYNLLNEIKVLLMNYLAEYNM